MITDGTSPASSVLKDARAVYTPGISERASGTPKFYHGDALGSTRGITNGSQTVTDAALYDAFGMTVSRTGTTATPFGFVGAAQYQSDADSGLQLLGHRMYDPSVGRFISQDPIQAGTNWYAYCSNEPLIKTDPEGLDDNPEGGIELGQGKINKPINPDPYPIPGNPPGPPGGPIQISVPIGRGGVGTIGTQPIGRSGGSGGRIDIRWPGQIIRLQGGVSNSGGNGAGGSVSIGGRDGTIRFGGSVITIGGRTTGTIGGEFVIGNPRGPIYGSGTGTVGGIGGKPVGTGMIKLIIKF